jgi:hypothetical protein
LAALAGSALFAPAASAEASVSVSHQSIAVTNFPVWLASCVNAGTGELLLLSGTLHTTSQIAFMRRDASAITASQRRGTYPMQRYIVFG